jgi:hypothetical protein
MLVAHMMTFRRFSDPGFHSVPLATTWALAELGHALGRQELFTRRSPQKLKRLREPTARSLPTRSRRTATCYTLPGGTT